jgi:hypothetical protein
MERSWRREKKDNSYTFNLTFMTTHPTTQQIALPATHHLPGPKPTVALVLPFDPKMTSRHSIDSMLKKVLADVEARLLASHEAKEAMPVIRRLQGRLRGLNFSSHRKSVALFISAQVEKTVYLDFRVGETVVIDRPFRIRDLADCKPAAREYLLLLLSATRSRMYLGEGDALRLIKSNSAQNNYFLHHMDVGLGAVLDLYELPVFIVGPDPVAGHFATHTKHEKNIAGYLIKDCIDAPEDRLPGMIHPMLTNWHMLTQQLLLRKMEKAAETGRLVCGLEEVRKAAGCSNARIVIVERGAAEESGNAFCTQGAIDEIVEKVLTNGGSVESLDPDLMAPYAPIALIRYY